MDFQTRLKIKQHELVHGKGPTVYELADHLQKSHSYICRISSITEEVPFPSELLVPAMKFKKNYDLLQLLAWECGFALVKLPGKVALDKREDNLISADYQKTSSIANNALLDVMAHLDEKSLKVFDESFKAIVEKSLSIKKTIDKRATKQLELF